MSRSLTGQRQIKNEEEVENCLTSLGFDILYPEKTHILDQIRLVQQSKFIVAPTGSAITLLAYADFNIKQLIIGTKLDPCTHFITGAETRTCFDYISSKICGFGSVIENNEFEVDIDHLRNTVQNIMDDL